MTFNARNSIAGFLDELADWGPVYTTPEEFYNGGLFLRLGPPFTLIRHENGAFRKHSLNRINLKTAAFRFRVDEKHFGNRVFRKHWRHDNHVSTLTEFSSNANPKWSTIIAFSNSSSVVWTELESLHKFILLVIYGKTWKHFTWNSLFRETLVRLQKSLLETKFLGEEIGQGIPFKLLYARTKKTR